MVGMVIVSHSEKLAQGVVELVKMMNPDYPVEAAGGMADGSLGTDFEKIKKAILQVNQGDGVVILADMGSSFMTTEMVLESLSDETIHLVDCPLVEGAVVASIEAVLGQNTKRVIACAVEAYETRKMM